LWRHGKGSPTVLPFPVQSIKAAVEQELQGTITLAPTKYQQSIEVLNAYEAIRSTWPELASMIDTHVHYILLFTDESLNSFASKCVQGILFLNLAFGQSFSYFIEDIVHQAGHVAFAAAWHYAPPILRGLGESPLRDWTGDQDHRTLEDALHGMVTLALIVRSLKLMLIKLEQAKHKDEIEARLLYALVKLGVDVHRIPQLPIFTDYGHSLIGEICIVYNEELKHFRHALRRVNFSGQAYNFNYSIYTRYNQHQRHVGD
jgi:hypothetical protein